LRYLLPCIDRTARPHRASDTPVFPALNRLTASWLLRTYETFSIVSRAIVSIRKYRHIFALISVIRAMLSLEKDEY
jgi:hypothetical protein